MYYLLKVSLLLSIITHVCSGSDLFTSTDRLRDLSAIEDEVFPDLNQAVEGLQDKISMLRMIVKEIKEVNKVGLDALTVAGHPVHAYSLIKRWHSISSVFAPDQNDIEHKEENIVDDEDDGEDDDNDEDDDDEITEGNELNDENATNDENALDDESSDEDAYDDVTDDEEDDRFDPNCRDNNESCKGWADRGECDVNPVYMLGQCKLSCGVCTLSRFKHHDGKLSDSNDASTCRDNNENCKGWASEGECDKHADYMSAECRLSCGFCKVIKPRNHDDPLLDGIFARIEKHLIPNNQDYDGSTEGLIRLQRTYNLTTDHLIQGNIHGFQSAETLTVADMFSFGKKAIDIGEWGYGMQWLQKALQLNNLKERQFGISMKLAKAYIQMKDYMKASEYIALAMKHHYVDIEKSDCYDKNDNCAGWAQTKACDTHRPYMFTHCRFSCRACEELEEEKFPGEYELANLVYTIKRKIDENGSLHHVVTTAEDPIPRSQQYEWKEKYEQLCRGQGIILTASAVCRYRPAGVPWNTYKEEILSLNPRISMVYDVINDQEAEMFKRKAKDKMFRALVGKEYEHSNNRVSNVGWLQDEDPDILRLSERVELITGMEITDTFEASTSSDQFQAVNYGIGGHYEPHVDYFSGESGLNGTEIGDIIQTSGDRIATFLLYLTDVTAGGATVYPRVNVHVPPIKNAAAFWYNSRLSGDYDPLTLHAGCPVLLGEKWVANKWVREYGNQFKRRCELTRDAEYS